MARVFNHCPFFLYFSTPTPADRQHPNKLVEPQIPMIDFGACRGYSAYEQVAPETSVAAGGASGQWPISGRRPRSIDIHNSFGAPLARRHRRALSARLHLEHSPIKRAKMQPRDDVARFLGVDSGDVGVHD
jgi:hypothetical protein